MQQSVEVLYHDQVMLAPDMQDIGKTINIHDIQRLKIDA